MPSPYGLAEIQCFGEANQAQLPRNLLDRHARGFRPVRDDPVQKDLNELPVRRGESEPDLETTPHSTVEQFSMVSCRNDNDVARQLIELHQQERNHTFDLAGLVGVAPLFSDRIEFVEEQDTRLGTHIVEQLAQPGIRLAKIAADQRIVANNEERKRESLGESFGKRRFAIAGGAGQQNTMAGLIAVGSQDVGPNMLLHQLAPVLADGERQEQIVQPRSRLDLDDSLPAVDAGADGRGRQRRRGDRYGRERTLKASART